MKQAWAGLERGSLRLLWVGVTAAIGLFALAIFFFTYRPTLSLHRSLADFFAGAGERVLLAGAVFGVANDLAAKLSRRLRGR